MEDLSRGFSLLNKCERNYSETINISHQIDEVCDNMRHQASYSYIADTNTQKNLKDFLQDNTVQIKNDIDCSINQVEALSKTVVEKGNVLVNDLQERLNTGCAALKRYNNNVQFNGKQLQDKMAKDKNMISVINANIFKNVEDMDHTHVRFMEQQQYQISESYRMIENKVTNQCTELNNCSNNIVEELRMSQRQVDKFLTEDFCRDVSTGTTPQKKEFSYPREFRVTSPPKRIVQRRHTNAGEDNLDPTDIYVSKQLSMPETLMNKTTSINGDRISFFTSTPCNDHNAVQLNTCSSATANTSIFPIKLPPKRKIYAEGSDKENLKSLCKFTRSEKVRSKQPFSVKRRSLGASNSSY